MRLIERDKRTLHLRRRGAAIDPYGEPVPEWGEPVALRAVCQPAAGALDAQIYGRRVKAMYTLFFDGLEPVRPGDGLCIHVAAQAHPDYRVIAVQGWDHQRADAELIPMEQRGAGGEGYAD